VERNARITAMLGALLIVLLAGEGVTIVFIGRMLHWHEVLGLILIAPVVLKLASVTWKFARYYLGAAEYVAQGPPHPFLRFLVGPVTVITTVLVFGSGVVLIVFHIHHGIVVGIHKASFVIWLGAMSLHVLAHIPRVLALTSRHEARSLRPEPYGHPPRR
jgi:uncharacterized membrane protein YbhN (UPF0104 family)